MRLGRFKVRSNVGKKATIARKRTSINSTYFMSMRRNLLCSRLIWLK